MNKLLIKIITVISFSTIILTGCAGTTDYTISLNNDYYIAKTSAYNVKIYKSEDKDESGKAPSIPIYHGNDEEFEKESVIKVGQDNRYIIAETNKDKYYILDTKEEFEEKKNELKIPNIPLEDLEEYK